MNLFGKNIQRFWFNFEVKARFGTKTSDWFLKKYLPALKLQNLCPSFSLRLILVSWLQPLCHQFFPLIFLRPDFFLFDESSQNYRPIFYDKFLSYKYFTCTISESCIDFSSLSLETLDFTFFTFLSLITASVSWTSVLFSSF